MNKTSDNYAKYKNLSMNGINNFSGTFYNKLKNKNNANETEMIKIDKNDIDLKYIDDESSLLNVIVEESEHDLNSNNCILPNSNDSINFVNMYSNQNSQQLNKSETEINNHKYNLVRKHFLSKQSEKNNNLINIDFEGILKLIGGCNKWQILIFLTVSLHQIPHAMLNLGVIYMMYQPDHWCKVDNFTKQNIDNHIFQINEIWNWNTLLESGLLYPIIDNEYHRKLYKHDQCNFYNRDNKELFDILENTKNITILNLIIKSNNIKRCQSWEYDDKIMKETVVTKFNIVCDNNWSRAHVHFSYSIGYLIGCLIGGYISDRYGRRMTLLVFTYLATFFAFLLPSTIDFGSFLIIRLILAICNEAANLAAYVLFMEITGTKYRSIVGCIQHVPWAIGYILLTFLAFLTRSWIIIHYISTLILFISTLFIFFIPESPRWLMVIGKANNAEEIIRKASKINKKSLPSDLELITHTERSRWIKKNKEPNFLNLLLLTNMSWKNGIVFFIWITAAFIYYGLVIVISDQSRPEKTIFSGNFFLNNGIAGFIELPTLLFCLYLMKFGRRKSQMIMFIFTGIFLILSMIFIFYEEPKASFIFILLSKMCIQGAFSILYIFTSELYPTILRNSAVGVSSMIGRCGSALSGYIAVLFDMTIPFIPISIFVIFSLITGIIIMFLPETKNIPLPETILDAVIFQKKIDREAKNDSIESAGNTKEVFST
uniref:Major facilitator superfamily (MFS) profile domain-containing protein n=3 Tax=Strongyloides stercoralis TaxID=6248 RepID=A0AAF5I300_STRER